MSHRISAVEAQKKLGEHIEVRGHIQTLRKLGNLAFLIVRDRTGSVQVVVEQPHLIEAVDNFSAEMPIVVHGQIVAHPNGKEAAVEMRASELKALSAASEPLPVEIAKNSKVDALSLSTLLDYRPLTLRNEKVKAIFKIEEALCSAFRLYLREQAFMEIHSPKIVATGTEGGAQLFALNYFGKPAFLAQSPQFYKQMMVGVFERVYEIGPVYRAEEHDTTRHLNEYISMDVEVGFISDEQDLMRLETELLKHMFLSVEQTCRQELALHGARIPEIEAIPQIKLADAAELLRRTYLWKTDSETIDLDPEAERLLCEHYKRTENTEMVFVTHYPHSVRPFYAMPECGTGLSHSFDLLYAGLEMTTGGQRIHELAQLCDSISARGLDPGSFSDYLQCFKYGMPPHGGFAIGLERLTKQLLGLANVKQASLFPRDRSRVTP